MVDLETLGTAPGSVILSIGAVRFGDELLPGRVDLTPENSCYLTANVESSVAAGLTMDASTVMWWLGQSDAARAAVSGAKQPLYDMLARFHYWATHLEPMVTTSPETPVDELWGNGADFDNVLLAEAYKAIGMAAPWKHRANRCYRTLRALRPDIEFVPPTVAHDALEDALAQANHAVKILQALK